MNMWGHVDRSVLMWLVLAMVLGLGVPNLLHDGAEARDIGESIWDFNNIMENCPRMCKVVPYTNSAK